MTEVLKPILFYLQWKLCDPDSQAGERTHSEILSTHLNKRFIFLYLLSYFLLPGAFTKEEYNYTTQK